MLSAASLGTSTSNLLSTLALGLRSIVSAPWMSSQFEDIPQALKKPRLSTGPETDDMNAAGLIEHVELELNSMSSHASSIGSVREKEALREFNSCNSNDFDQSKDQGQAKGGGSPETLVTPRASCQSNQSPEVTEKTDYPSSLLDPPLHLQLLEACVGSFTMQNVRPYQEDRTAFMVLGNTIHIGMFDGHAGGTTSTYLQENLLSAIYDQGLRGVHGAEALEQAFLDTNNDLRKIQTAYSCGSTATTVIIDGSTVLCANAGDSPAFVVSRSGEALSLTIDHNPNTNESEKLRVEAAGGRIEKMNWGERNKRVLSYDSLSGLAMTRAFGDFNFPGVICNPHISETSLGQDAQYLIVASDGLTEQWTISGVAHAVWDLARMGYSPTNIASMISRRAMEMGSRDNITVVVLDLDAYVVSCKDSLSGSDDIRTVADQKKPDGVMSDEGRHHGSEGAEGIEEESPSVPDVVAVASLLM